MAQIYSTKRFYFLICMVYSFWWQKKEAVARSLSLPVWKSLQYFADALAFFLEKPVSFLFAFLFGLTAAAATDRDYRKKHDDSEPGYFNKHDLFSFLAANIPFSQIRGKGYNVATLEQTYNVSHRLH